MNGFRGLTGAFLRERKSWRVLACGMLVASIGLADVITVNNPSFETLPAAGLTLNCGPGCRFDAPGANSIPGWAGGDGQFQPGAPGFTTYFNTLASDGSLTNGYSDGTTISQTVAPTVQTGVVYTLLVDIGRRNDSFGTTFEGSVDLLINGVHYVATGASPNQGFWSTFTATYTGLAADSGKPITIELLSNGDQANFDNVRLSDNVTSGTVPEPRMAFWVVMTVLGLGGLWRRFGMNSVRS